MKAGYLVSNRPIYVETRIENNVCALLLHAGYLTPYENKSHNLVYVVPNKEIKRYFYEKLFMIWIDKAIEKNKINLFTWIDKYIDCLEDKDQLQYLIQVELLDKMTDCYIKNEAFFQIYTGGIALIALEQALRPNMNCI
ncbi:unnamed protein product [Blepharisma stoltei]|uniref:Uncharacterized protein n=1 Tax=Blepharisma stoltei TaxID=1481888 RepID=A0AAU9JLH6_9CILI|nr:unnamed protein product [Blepharisma stoltei]